MQREGELTQASSHPTCRGPCGHHGLPVPVAGAGAQETMSQDHLQSKGSEKLAEGRAFAGITCWESREKAKDGGHPYSPFRPALLPLSPQAQAQCCSSWVDSTSSSRQLGG